MSKQADAMRCDSCGRWFMSGGGLAVHRCRRPEESPDSGGGTAAAPQGQVVCTECGGTFSRLGDFKRHKCLLERSRPVEEQRGSVQCTLCHRWFRSAGGLGAHKRRLNATESWNSLLP